MKGISAISSLLSLQVWPLTLVDAIEYLEPNVQRIERVLPLNVCKQLIDLGEEGTLSLYLRLINLYVLFCLLPFDK